MRCPATSAIRPAALSAAASGDASPTVNSSRVPTASLTHTAPSLAIAASQNAGIASST